MIKLKRVKKPDNTSVYETKIYYDCTMCEVETCKELKTDTLKWASCLTQGNGVLSKTIAFLNDLEKRRF